MKTEPKLRLEFIEKALNDLRKDKPKDYKTFNSTKDLDKFVKQKNK